jgi:hypothetical protein
MCVCVCERERERERERAPAQCELDGGRGCSEGNFFNLQFKMYEIAALNAMILNSMPQTSKRCYTDCSYSDFVKWLNPVTHAV